MKQRDVLFLAIPCGILALFCIMVAALLIQHYNFKRAYIQDFEDELRSRTELIANSLSRPLVQHDDAAVDEYIHRFKDRPLRVTVIDASGKVVADSRVGEDTLSNHLNRPEIINAGAENDFQTRYSTTLQTWQMYYAVKAGPYYVRTSMPLTAITGILNQVRLSIMLAAILGICLVLAISLYLTLRIRPHFIALQSAAVAIAQGKLDTRISVPHGGILHELAHAVATMASQLRHRIADLQRERNEFDALFNTLQEPLLVISHDGNVLQRNRAASRLFGLANNTSPLRIERTASPELIAYAREALQSQQTSEREITFETSAGPRALLAHAVRLERHGSICLLLLLTDLTELRRLEGYRADFVANVSHEIKTPLTAILATVETLSEGTPDEQQKKRCMEILTRQSSRLNDLVLDILSLAAIERRQGTETDFVPFKLDDLCRDAVALTADDARRANVTLSLVEPMPHTTLQGDPRLIEQAIVNLISNGLRHSGSPTLELILQTNATNAILRVRDEGCGIASEHLPRLFERFYRVYKERSRAKGGTGLGLAIVKHVALLHHGTIDVTSTVGKGTTFTLTLPLKQNLPDNA